MKQEAIRGSSGQPIALNNQLNPMDTKNQTKSANYTFSLREVSDLLKISQRTLRTWIKFEIISGFFKIGRQWRIRQIDLNNFISKRIKDINNDNSKPNK